MGKPRYTIATISTTDDGIVEKAQYVQKSGVKHLDIYLAGLEYYIKLNNIQIKH